MYNTITDVIRQYEDAAMHASVPEDELLSENEVREICHEAAAHYEELAESIIDALMDETLRRAVES